MAVNKKIKRALSNMSLKTLFKRTKSRSTEKTTKNSDDFADKTPKIDEKWRKQVARPPYQTIRTLLNIFG